MFVGWVDVEAAQFGRSDRIGQDTARLDPAKVAEFRALPSGDN